MNKDQLTIILQSTLFSFEGATDKDILKLNPDYNQKFVLIGIQLKDFLENKVK